MYKETMRQNILATMSVSMVHLDLYRSIFCDIKISIYRDGCGKTSKFRGLTTLTLQFPNLLYFDTNLILHSNIKIQINVKINNLNNSF